MKNILSLITLMLVSLTSATVLANSRVNGGDFYVHPKVNAVVVEEFSEEHTRVGLQLFAGYNFNDYFGLEIGQSKLFGLEDRTVNDAFDEPSLAFVSRYNFGRKYQTTFRFGATSSEAIPFASIGFGYFLYLESQITFELEARELEDGSHTNGLVIGYQYNF